MKRYAALAHLFLLVVWLVPFTSTRQAAVACAPIFPVAPVESQAPANEEEDQRENETEGADESERISDPARPRVRREPTRGPSARAGHTIALAPRARPPVPQNPLRNGLGTHYRC